MKLLNKNIRIILFPCGRFVRISIPFHVHGNDPVITGQALKLKSPRVPEFWEAMDEQDEAITPITFLNIVEFVALSK